MALGLGGFVFLLYLNQVGLPDFLKKPLLNQLHARGLDLYFSRLRLRWTRGIVAEDVNLGQAAEPLGPQLFIDEAEVRLNHAALLRFKLKVDALILRKGRFCYPLPGKPGSRATQFNLEDMGAELWFLPDDRWEIRRLDAQCLQSKIEIVGSVGHASDLGRLRKASTPGATPLAARKAALERNLRAFVDTMTRFRFTDVPRLEVRFELDTHQPARMRTAVSFHFEAVETPWGRGRRLNLAIDSRSSATNDLLLRTDVRFQAERWRGAELTLQRPDFSGHLVHPFDSALPQEVQGELSAGSVQTSFLELNNPRLSFAGHAEAAPSNWTAQASVAFDRAVTPVGRLAASRAAIHLGIAPQAPRMPLAAHLANAATNRWLGLLRSPWLPTNVAARLDLGDLETRWGAADSVKVDLDLATRPLTNRLSNPGWSHWAWLEPFTIRSQVEAWRIAAPQLRIERANLTADWSAPRFALPRLEAHLFGGHFRAEADLDVDSRAVSGRGVSSCDIHQVALLLNANGQRWLRQYGWDVPPLAEATVSVVLPAWTNRAPNWRGEVQPTLTLDGYVEGGACSFRGAAADSARLHFSCQNGSWHIPDLHLDRPEGVVDLAYAADVPTQDYVWRVRGSIDPNALRPLLPPGAQRALDRFEFTAPPLIAGDVWGRWHAVERLGFASSLTLTNFSLNQERFDLLTGNLAFTNRFLSATNLHARRGEGRMDASGLGFAFAPSSEDSEPARGGGTLFLTNVVAVMDPGPVTRAIGPKTAAALESYRFGSAPRVVVNGSLGLPGPEDARMAFEVAGGPFKYSKFNASEVRGRVLWNDRSVTVTNFQGDFYQGRIAGWLQADVGATNGSDIGFQLGVENVEARALLRDVSNSGNKVEGRLSGQLNVTHLNSQDWSSWMGNGRVRLREGLIWDIPLFGFLSSKLDAVLPGVANIRFEQGAGTFIITNSVIYTQDLAIRSPWLRLNLEGAIDFEHRIDLRIGAELFKDTPLLLRLPLAIVSLAATPFVKVLEYRATGTLREPRWEPVYIPKLFLLPFHPVKTIKGIFAPEPPSPQPGSAPSKKP